MGCWISHCSLCTALREQQTRSLLFSPTSLPRPDLHGKTSAPNSSAPCWELAGELPTLSGVSEVCVTQQKCHNEASHAEVHICGSWADLSHSITFPPGMCCASSKFSPRDEGDSSSPFLGENHKSSQEITGKRESAPVSRAGRRLFCFPFIFLLLIPLPTWHFLIYFFLILVSSSANFIWLLPHRTPNSVSI